MRYFATLILAFLLSNKCNAQCTLNIDSVLSTNVSCNGLSDGSITVFASGGNGPISFSNASGAEVISPNQPFEASNALSTAGGSGPTNRWWSPSTCTGGVSFQYSTTQGCPAGSAVYSGPSSGFAGCFLRSPQLNMNGIDLVTVSFDLSNSFAANRTNDRLRFYAWVNNSYLSVPAAYTVNGINSQFYNFNQANACATITVTVNLSSIPTNNRSDFFFYIEANCQYNNCTPYLAVVDNIVISEAASTQASNLFSGLQAGNYPISISDASGCVVTLPTPIQIIEPDVLVLNATTQDVSIIGGSDGSVQTEVFGGNGGYTYLWNTTPPQNSANASGLSAGSYILTVTDAEGCNGSITVQVAEPSCTGLSIVSVESSNPLCAGVEDGSIAIIAEGPNNGLSYSINGLEFQSSGIFESLQSGFYNLEIADSAGCSLVFSGNPIQIQAPQPLTVQIEFEDNQLFVEGFISYQWYLNDNLIEGATSGVLMPSTNGIYTVSITDENGCITLSEGFEVLTTAIGLSDSVKSWLLYPNPGKNLIRLNRNRDGGQAFLGFWSLTGQLVMEQSINGSESLIDVEALSPGIYLVRLTDNQGTGQCYWIKGVGVD